MDPRVKITSVWFIGVGLGVSIASLFGVQNPSILLGSAIGVLLYGYRLTTRKFKRDEQVAYRLKITFAVFLGAAPLGLLTALSFTSTIGEILEWSSVIGLVCLGAFFVWESIRVYSKLVQRKRSRLKRRGKHQE